MSKLLGFFPVNRGIGLKSLPTRQELPPSFVLIFYDTSSVWGLAWVQLGWLDNRGLVIARLFAVQPN
jgi:hypothetical protein